MSKLRQPPTSEFIKTCVHCEHYHAKGACCFCHKDYYHVELKTKEQHLEELGDLEDII